MRKTLTLAFYTSLAGVALAQTTGPLDAISEVAFDKIYEQIALSDDKVSRSYEKDYSKAGGVIIVGTVGEIMAGARGAYFVLLKYTGTAHLPSMARSLKNAGRFLVYPANAAKVRQLNVGDVAKLSCAAPTRSGYLVASECEVLE